MRESRKFLTEERGNVIILFALTLVVLVGMIALATDIGLLAIKRAQLMEVGQIMRDARMEQSELLWNADNPAKAFDDCVREYGLKNGLSSDQIQTTYQVIQNTSTTRQYKVTMTFHDTYQCTTLRLFGFNQIPITVTINGSAIESSTGGVWSP